MKRIVFFIVGLLCPVFMFSQSGNYKIVKIDTLKKHYVISIQKDHFFAKVVSRKKCKRPKKEAIQINKYYFFELSRFPIFNFLNKMSFEVETSGKGCIAIDEECVWKPSDDFYLYSSNNLKGLYYFP